MAASSEPWSSNKDDYELQEVIGEGGTATVQVIIVDLSHVLIPALDWFKDPCQLVLDSLPLSINGLYCSIVTVNTGLRLYYVFTANLSNVDKPYHLGHLQTKLKVSDNFIIEIIIDFWALFY